MILLGVVLLVIGFTLPLSRLYGCSALLPLSSAPFWPSLDTPATNSPAAAIGIDSRPITPASVRRRRGRQAPRDGGLAERRGESSTLRPPEPRQTTAHQRPQSTPHKLEGKETPPRQSRPNQGQPQAGWREGQGRLHALRMIDKAEDKAKEVIDKARESMPRM